jgi:hypothetical protein
MYGALWLNLGFHLEVDRFIEATKKHEMTNSSTRIHFPCTDCNNIFIWKDANTIKLHLIMHDFVMELRSIMAK